MNEKLKPGIFLRTGHRGAAGLAPENTMPSFQKAVDIGVDLIELDVQSTSDGRIVVLHDPTVDRTTNGRGEISRMTYDEASLLDAGYAFGEPAHPFRGQGVRIPLLEEVVDAFPNTGFTIEIKSSLHPGFFENVAAIVRTKCGDRSIIASDDFTAIDAIRRAIPNVPTNLSRPEVRRFYWMSHAGISGFFRSPGRVFQVPVRNRINEWLELRVVTRKFVRHAHKLGLPVQVWTINDPQQMRDLADMGVDGITTDRPDLLNMILENA